MSRERRHQAEVLIKAEGALEATVLYALARTGVFLLFGGDERSAEELALETGCDPGRLERLLNAGVAVGALTRSPSGCYRPMPAYASTLGASDADHFLGDWLEFLARLTPHMLALAEATKPGGARSHWPNDEEDGAVMARAMEVFARTRGLDIVARLDLTGDARLLDLGCGSGAYGIAFAEQYADLFVTLVDLPEVAPTVESLRETHPTVVARSEIIAADVFEFRPSEPYDVVFMSNVLHMCGPELAASLIERARSMLRPGGRLIIQAQFLDGSRVSPRWSVLLDAIQMVITPTGANHSIDETRGWLERAGFKDITRVETPLWNVCEAVVAVNPG